VGGIVAPRRDQKWAFAVKIVGEVHKVACRRYPSHKYTNWACLCRRIVFVPPPTCPYMNPVISFTLSLSFSLLIYFS
jgi:hypothetical protein